MTSVLESINLGLQNALADNPRVLIMGEDILDPYGGAFKITRGLSERFPDRVITTPISEAGFVGLAAGMALRGLRPVVEIMFGDFLTLAADQLINHAAKFSWMYSGGKKPEESVPVPMVVRTPMGGRRGYGPTHSQTLEKIFLGTPGLRVIAPSVLGDPGKLLYDAIILDKNPVLFIENKLLYLMSVQDQESLGEFDVRQWPSEKSSGYAPTYSLVVRSAPPPTITVAAYGYMTELARQAALALAYEHEVFVEIVSPTQLSPFEIQAIIESTERTGRLLTVEEGTLSLGWGAEITARTSEALGPKLLNSRRVAAAELPVPASQTLEAAVLPGVDDVIQASLAVI